MQAVGIICEYNPFHNGHLYHLHKVKELYPNYPIVLVMSGNFMQRGEASVLNKWEKAKIALEYGVDLVVELPFPFATQSADIFARGSIQLLEALQVSSLVFGSESSDILYLEEIVRIQLDEPRYEEEVRKLLDQGHNYPGAMAKALTSFSVPSIGDPNDLLGISYIKSIREMGSKITPATIKRTSSHHENTVEKVITSGSAIRKALRKGINIQHTVPPLTQKYLSELSFTGNYYTLLKYKIMTEGSSLSTYQTVDEGLQARIVSSILECSTIEELIQKVKTKRYTYNRLSRMFTHILCNFTKEEAKSFQNIEYIRILGFTAAGRQYLHSIKKDISIPIVTNFGDTQSRMLALEYRATCVYASIYPYEKQKKMIESEYKNAPIQKD